MAVQAGNQAGRSQVSTAQPLNNRPNRQSCASRHKTALDSVAREATQTQKSQPNRIRSVSIGSGKTTGGRASGRRIQPSVRRRRSQWEVSSDETRLPVQIRSAAVGIAVRAPSKCSKCHGFGHRKNSKACPMKYSGSASQSESKGQERCIVVKL
ncbi:zinc knuckle domain-containing protein [Pochonia chlamydosporia 170]|uniref:Zinc knuckle domain-containing protein n=1 Tax=Pochonia chlamydosporia 170 TaxID=1380566 RepID=A0A219ANZ4_METCM|nr:zinc knuckle domain-containing protein [Pochonia chlamydosporia 170]OWT42282.1 zinc knuckle domain-containing protein [Pochonia chlamydosporia 170]